MAALEMLIEEFGHSIGLPELALDEEDSCALTFDELAVVLSYRRDQGRLCLYSDVGLIEQASTPLLLRLLEANALQKQVGDGAIGLCPDEERRLFVVVYSRLLDVQALTLARFDRAMREFVVMAETWRGRLADLVDEAAGEEDREGGGTPDEPMEIIRV